MHMDECLYSAYAVRMVEHGDIGLNGGLKVDKPPVYFYFLALSFLAAGISEISARLPNVIFALASAWMLFLITLRIYRKFAAGALGAIFLLFSLYYTWFSATAFQDISMTFFFLAALYFSLRKKYFLSALMYGLSVSCKPMTIFVAPLYLYFILSFDTWENVKQNIKNFAAAFAWVFIPLILWSALLANPRLGIFKFFVTQQPGAMNVSLNFSERLMAWVGFSKYILNDYWLLTAAIAGISFLAIKGSGKKSRANRGDIFLLLTLSYIYLGLTLIKFRQFDRYLIIAAPFAALALARTVTALAGIIKNRIYSYGIIVAALVSFIIYIPGYTEKNSSMGALFTGADGFEKTAEFLGKKADLKTRLIYYGDAMSWYGYFYLRNARFESAQIAYNREELDKLCREAGSFLIVASECCTPAGGIPYLGKKYENLFEGRFAVYGPAGKMQKKG